MKKYLLAVLSLSFLVSCQISSKHTFDREWNLMRLSDGLVSDYVLTPVVILDASLRLDASLSGVEDESNPSFEGEIENLGNGRYKLSSIDLSMTIDLDREGKTLYEDGAIVRIPEFDVYIPKLYDSFMGAATIQKKPSEAAWIVSIGEVNTEISIVSRADKNSVWNVSAAGFVGYGTDVSASISTEGNMMVKMSAYLAEPDKIAYGKTFQGQFHYSLYHNHMERDNCLATYFFNAEPVYSFDSKRME